MLLNCLCNFRESQSVTILTYCHGWGGLKICTCVHLLVLSFPPFCMHCLVLKPYSHVRTPLLMITVTEQNISLLTF